MANLCGLPGPMSFWPGHVARLLLTVGVLKPTTENVLYKYLVVNVQCACQYFGSYYFYIMFYVISISYDHIRNV